MVIGTICSHRSELSMPFRWSLQVDARAFVTGVSDSALVSGCEMRKREAFRSLQPLVRILSNHRRRAPVTGVSAGILALGSWMRRRWMRSAHCCLPCAFPYELLALALNQDAPCQS